jgi:3-oxoacyl-[acyl-carrier protein] reductase
MTITAGPPEPIPYIGGFGPACAAIEGLWRGLAGFSRATLLKRLPLAAEVANVAAMMASDRASAMTGTFVHVTCGSRE